MPHGTWIGIGAELLLDGRLPGIEDGQPGSLLCRFVFLFGSIGSFAMHWQHFLSSIASLESWLLEYWPTQTDHFLIRECLSRRISSFILRRIMVSKSHDRSSLETQRRSGLKMSQLMLLRR